MRVIARSIGRTKGQTVVAVDNRPKHIAVAIAQTIERTNMTQQSKFTPGPWRLCYDGQIDGADGNFVCSFRWSSYKDFNDPENKATARLIAQAPEMYELLEMLDTYHTRIVKNPSNLPSLKIALDEFPTASDIYMKARRIKAEIDGEVTP